MSAKEPDVSALLKRDYSPLLAGIGCVSFLVILGFFIAGIGLMLYSFFKFFDLSVNAPSIYLWGGGCLFGGVLLILLIQGILKLAGISQQEFVAMTLIPPLIAINNLGNWRNRVARKQSDNQNAISAGEFYAQIKAKASARDVQASDDENSPAPETNKED